MIGLLEQLLEQPLEQPLQVGLSMHFQQQKTFHWGISCILHFPWDNLCNFSTRHRRTLPWGIVHNFPSPRCPDTYPKGMVRKP